MFDITRRKAIAGIGGLTTTALAGCAGDESENGKDGTPDDDNGDDDSDGAENGEDNGEEVEEAEEETDEAEEEVEEEVEEEEEADDGMSADEFAATLDVVYGGTVVDYDEEEDYGFLTVEAEQGGTAEQMAAEVGAISGGYASYVKEGDPPSEALEVQMLSVDGSQVAGHFTVETEWAEQYNAGEISDEQFSQNILNTVEAAE
ncbi:hypothetical protein C491_13212 [Natronococcus amylolyticus DSM 10524]|uniref:DUF8159 domain-containing protein n=1 Tax=Natronococcus amylolyticus DSM 10524 TaxID=1227497 RepID=L9X497_9EURY|nr:hypothetical protein [Natronococcus amylolyticus]ELY56500.1 hypothetical protein C491_13212 [Natronococcus amylolyticus DSM 10524]